MTLPPAAAPTGPARPRRLPPVVCVVAGPAGSGKSTLGRAMAKMSGAMVLDQDVATNPLMAQLAAVLGAEDNLDHPALRGSVRRARYQCLVDIAVDNRRLGRSVVMIAPFTAEVAGLPAWQMMAAQLAPARVVLVWVAVSPEVARARRLRRNLPRDRAAGLAEDAPAAALVPVVEHLLADGGADPQLEARRLVQLIGPW